MQDPPIEPNRHLKCYKEPKVYNPVEERAKKTLAKMLSSAKKEVLIDETDADAAYSDRFVLSQLAEVNCKKCLCFCSIIYLHRVVFDSFYLPILSH